MANAPVLELASLPQRHPDGDAFLREFGACVILRLSVDPVRRAPGTLKCEVVVDRVSASSAGAIAEGICEIGWSGLPEFSDAYCDKLRRVFNDETITEGAA